jgi:hypothetical protein
LQRRDTAPAFRCPVATQCPAPQGPLAAHRATQLRESDIDCTGLLGGVQASCVSGMARMLVHLRAPGTFRAQSPLCRKAPRPPPSIYAQAHAHSREKARHLTLSSMRQENHTVIWAWLKQAAPPAPCELRPAQAPHRSTPQGFIACAVGRRGKRESYGVRTPRSPSGPSSVLRRPPGRPLSPRLQTPVRHHSCQYPALPLDKPCARNKKPAGSAGRFRPCCWR